MASKQKKVPLLILKQAIHLWLDARQQMMCSFNELCAIKPFEQQDQSEVQQSVEGFCTALIDYLSYGQFKVFDLITSSIPTQGKQSSWTKLFDGIFHSTLKSLEFNDRYTENFDLFSLSKDLSDLGVHLSKRLDLEDFLIDKAFEHINAESTR